MGRPLRCGRKADITQTSSCRWRVDAALVMSVFWAPFVLYVMPIPMGNSIRGGGERPRHPQVRHIQPNAETRVHQVFGSGRREPNSECGNDCRQRRPSWFRQGRGGIYPTKRACTFCWPAPMSMCADVCNAVTVLFRLRK